MSVSSNGVRLDARNLRMPLMGIFINSLCALSPTPPEMNAMESTEARASRNTIAATTNHGRPDVPISS